MFTAAEVLRAGLQAEADGKYDYAVQFFRHLTDHHAHSPEAHEARAALQRIASRRAPDQARLDQRAANGAHATRQQSAPAQPVLVHTAAQPSAHEPPRAAGQAAAATANSPAAQQNKGTSLPPPGRRYLVGRIMAMLFVVLGWLMAALGLLLLGLGMVIGGNLPLVSKLGSTVITGPALVLLGCALIFWGQLARAIFDTANAARDLAAIERLRLERRRGPHD